MSAVRADDALKLVVEEVWHPDPTRPGKSWRSALPSDPDVPSPGVYEVATDPATQTITVRVIRLVGGDAA